MTNRFQTIIFIALIVIFFLIIGLIAVDLSQDSALSTKKTTTAKVAPSPTPILKRNSLPTSDIINQIKTARPDPKSLPKCLQTYLQIENHKNFIVTIFDKNKNVFNVFDLSKETIETAKFNGNTCQITEKTTNFID